MEWTSPDPERASGSPDKHELHLGPPDHARVVPSRWLTAKEYSRFSDLRSSPKPARKCPHCPSLPFCRPEKTRSQRSCLGGPGNDSAPCLSPPPRFGPCWLHRAVPSR